MLTRTLAGLAVLTALVGAPSVRAGDVSSDRAQLKASSKTAAAAPAAPAIEKSCSCSQGKA